MPLLFDSFDRVQIERAIAMAETKTSGEIRVVIYPHDVADPVEAARREFQRLGMTKTRERNAVLILVAPRSRRYAIFGDEGVHLRCGPSFWSEVARAMAENFRRNEFTEGVVHAIRRAGEMLGQHFPHHPDDKNELPDDVVERGIVI